MTWLKVLEQKEWPGREGDTGSVCGIPFDVAKAIGVHGGNLLFYYLISLSFSSIT